MYFWKCFDYGNGVICYSTQIEAYTALVSLTSDGFYYAEIAMKSEIIISEPRIMDLSNALTYCISVIETDIEDSEYIYQSLGI